MNKIYGRIYKITTDFNDKFYIGKTVGSIEGRLKRHIRRAKSFNPKIDRPSKILSSIKKNTVENIILFKKLISLIQEKN